MKRKAAVLYGPRDIRVEMRDMPVLGENDVLIKVKSVGICGSDLHYYQDFKMGKDICTGPHILGHECAGDIVEVGSAVKDRKVGQRVAVEPGIPCFHCEYCLTGRYNLCKNMVFRSHPMSEGALVEYLATPAVMTFPMFDSMSYDCGAMVEPLSVGIHALKRGGSKVCDKIAIYGCGTIGLCILMAAKAMGISQIIMCDINEYRMGKAREFGANIVIDSSKEDFYQTVMDATDGTGVDGVYDTVANNFTLSTCTRIARRGGVVTHIAMYKEPIAPLNMYDLIDKEMDFRGIFRYANTYKLAVAMESNGQTNLQKLITHTYSIDDIKEAMEMALCNRGTKEVLKVVVRF